jgi:hypothetical protein
LEFFFDSLRREKGIFFKHLWILVKLGGGKFRVHC